MRNIMIIGLIISLLFLTGCTSNEKTISTLQKAGYNNIETTGWKAFDCGNGDFTSTGFIAINSNNETVEGTVCCGLLKKCTVRY